MLPPPDGAIAGFAEPLNPAQRFNQLHVLLLEFLRTCSQPRSLTQRVLVTAALLLGCEAARDLIGQLFDPIAQPFHRIRRLIEQIGDICHDLLRMAHPYLTQDHRFSRQLSVRHRSLLTSPDARQDQGIFARRRWFARCIRAIRGNQKPAFLRLNAAFYGQLEGGL